MTNKTMNVQNMLNSSLDDIVKMQRRNPKGGRQNNNNRGKPFANNRSPFQRNKPGTGFNRNNKFNNNNNNNNNNRMRQSPFMGNNNRRGLRTPKNSPAAFAKQTPQKSKWNVENRLNQPLDSIIKGRKFRNNNNFRGNKNQNKNKNRPVKGIKAMSQMRRPVNQAGVRTPKVRGAAFKARAMQPRRNALKPVSRVVNTRTPRRANVQLNSIHRHLFSRRTNLSLSNRRNNASVVTRRAPIDRKKKPEIVYRGHTEKRSQPIDKELLSKIRVMATLDNLPPPMPQQRGSIVSMPASMSGGVSEKSIESSSVYTSNTERKTLSERFGY